MTLAAFFPLPFTCGHARYLPGAKDDHGNAEPGWHDPVVLPCAWWSSGSAEPSSPPTGGDRVVVDLVLALDSAVVVDHRDRFVIEGFRFGVIGLPKDFDHGPWAELGFVPGRRILELKWVG